jgi:cell division protein FtsW
MGARVMNDWLKKIGIDLPVTTGKRPVRLGFDVPLVLLTTALVIFGLLMVYSASWDFGYQYKRDPLYYFERQIFWVILGIGVLLAGTFIRFQRWTQLALPIMIFSIFGLLAVLALGDERHGAIRGLLGGSYQPSEAAKLVMVIYLSVWLNNRRDQLKDIWFGLVPLGSILGIVGFLILAQPDYSAVITIGFIGVLMFFLVGADLRQILILAAAGFVFGYVAYLALPTAQARINDYFAGINSLLAAHPHVQRALEAFVNGGWIGSGIGMSQTKLTGLPFPHTDSIFAVVGEEVGVLGSSLLVLIYVGILWRGMSIAGRAKDLLGRLLAAGLTFWMVSEAMINMGVMVGLLPFAGNALPFISSGGSNLLVMMAAVGILLNISRQVEQTKEKQERTFDSIINLRRRDGRRRVSRTVRTSGAVRRS